MESIIFVILTFWGCMEYKNDRVWFSRSYIWYYDMVNTKRNTGMAHNNFNNTSNCNNTTTIFKLKHKGIKMEYNQLSGYDQYILLTLQAKGIGANVAAFNQFTEVLKFLESCAKSDNTVVHIKDKVITKPFNRSQSQQILESIRRNKWDDRVKECAKAIGAELR